MQMNGTAANSSGDTRLTIHTCKCILQPPHMDLGYGVVTTRGALCMSTAVGGVLIIGSR